MKSVLAFIATTFVALSMSAPAVATPGTLPATDHLYNINCAGTEPDFQVFEVSPLDASMTRVGTGWPGPNTWACGSSAVQDPSSGLYWTVLWVDYDTSDPGWDYGIGTVDGPSGVVTQGPGFNYQGDTEWDDLNIICFDGEGTLYALGVAQVSTVDKVTGEVTVLGGYTNAIGGLGGCDYNFNDGLIYVSDFDSNDFYTFEPSTRTFTYVGDIPVSNGQRFNFDSAGNIWLQNWNDLMFGSLSDLSGISTVATMKLDGVTHGAQSLFVDRPWSAPESQTSGSSSDDESLAATGFDTAHVALAGLVLLLVGGLAMRARRA